MIGNNTVSGTQIPQFFGSVGPCPAYGAFFYRSVFIGRVTRLE